MVLKSRSKDPYQDHLTKNLGEKIRILQINAEGLSRAKGEYISKLMLEQKVDIAIIQETHIENENQQRSRGKIPGFDLLGATYHRFHGVATYARNNIENCHILLSSVRDSIHQVIIKVAGITVVNIYKPPSIPWPPTTLDLHPHPTVYAGDFNSHHTAWKYRESDVNGEQLHTWAEANNLSLIFDAKDKGSFKSAAWNTETNPDLCFVTENAHNRPVPITRLILDNFPHSQHRPILLTIGIAIPIIHSTPRPRWNFNKANWAKFTMELDSIVRWIPPKSFSYSRFSKAIITTAKKYVPRGFRKEYIPGWNRNLEQLYQDFQDSGDPEVADDLLNKLDAERRKKWEETTRDMDFKTSSRKAWSLLKKLGSSNPPNRVQQAVTADQIATRVVKLSKAPKAREHNTAIKKELQALRLTTGAHPDFSNPFTIEEVNKALGETKHGKAPGFDGIHPEFLKYCGKHARMWLSKFYSDILATGCLPKDIKKAKIIAVLKPNKPINRADSYRPIALLSSCYKLLERLLMNRISSEILEKVPIEQAGFRPHRSCTDQVLSLTTHIEAGFQRRLKTVVAFIDLTAAYDTVWRDGLLYKLLRAIPCSLITTLINNMLCDRTFQVITGGSISRARKLQNGLPQGSVLAPLLFNLYISDIPLTTANKYAYADDIALAARHHTITGASNILSEDLAVLGKYFNEWRLTPNTNKTEVTCFHLNNKQANTEPEVYFNNNLLRSNPHPKYLGITMDRTLSFRKHLENTAAKINTRNNIIHKLCGTSWGANANTLRTSALSLVYSVAEYSSPVWINSCHVAKIDSKLNQTMRLISGCIKSTPIPWLPVLSHIAPPHIRRQANLLREYRNINANLQLPIHSDVPDVSLTRLKSRVPPLLTAKQLQATGFSVHAKWEECWETAALSQIPWNPNDRLPGMNLTRPEWKTLNRIRTSHGLCRDSLYRWGLSQIQSCDCGEPRQTIKHIALECPLTAYAGNLDDFFHATDAALKWINALDIKL